jgi:hypothetical protein
VEGGVEEVKGAAVRDEYIVERDLVAAGAAETGRVPGIEDGDFTHGHQPEDQPRPGGGHYRGAALQDGPADGDMCRERDGRGEAGAAGDPVSADGRVDSKGGGVAGAGARAARRRKISAFACSLVSNAARRANRADVERPGYRGIDPSHGLDYG